MPIQKVAIEVDRQARSIVPGAARGQDIIDLAGITGTEQVLLEVQGDVDIPLSASDIVFIRGGEKFSVGDGSPVVDDNPSIRKPVQLALDDQVLTLGGPPFKAKIIVRDLKAIIGAGNHDLWADLDGLADELLEDDDRLVLQPQDKFFTVPLGGQDRFYEVTVILDGEARQRRFPYNMTVLEATRRSLPPRDRSSVADFDMVDADIGTAPLAPALTLQAAGIRDGHVLSITKKNGGGG